MNPRIIPLAATLWLAGAALFFQLGTEPANSSGLRPRALRSTAPGSVSLDRVPGEATVGLGFRSDLLPWRELHKPSETEAERQPSVADRPEWLEHFDCAGPCVGWYTEDGE